MVVMAGRLEDMGYSEHAIARISATIGFSLLFLWTVYHMFGGAAANSRFNQPTDVSKQKFQASSNHCLA